LRKAIEDVNSGNLVPKSQSPLQEIPITPITPVSEPLLMKEDKEVYNSNTITSVDSLFQSNSENCSTDIELDNFRNNMNMKQ
jgi:hypothetical protein